MSDIKENLIQRALNQRKLRLQKKKDNDDALLIKPKHQISDALCRFEDYPVYQDILQKKMFGQKFGIKNPFFIMHDALASATSNINNETFINFSSYNYLNLNGDPRVSAAAKHAIDHYGTSVSASRLVSGERPIQQQLENTLAQLHGVESSLVFVSGHATNVTTIGYLFGEKDLILHDELIHDSVRQGITLSGAFRLTFPHNDWQTLNKLLETRRHEFERVLIVIEGIYSMDGDYPDLPQFIEIKKRHKAFLMVDEAHSIGVMGKNGRGIGEHFDINTKDVDIWMGTLSKTMAGCGGYIAGVNALVEHLKFAAPGFLYSVGIAPPLAAAALASIEIMLNEPERIVSLCARGKQFLDEANKAGLKTGLSQGLNIVPIICGSSRKAVQLSNRLFEKRINVQPIIYPAVPENEARLRFFISSAHTPEQITTTIQEISRLY